MIVPVPGLTNAADTTAATILTVNKMVNILSAKEFLENRKIRKYGIFKCLKEVVSLNVLD